MSRRFFLYTGLTFKYTGEIVLLFFLKHLHYSKTLAIFVLQLSRTNLLINFLPIFLLTIFTFLA